VATDLLSYACRDVKGLPYGIPVYIAAEATLANIQLFADDLTDAMDDVTGGVIENIYITKELVVHAGAKTDPTAGSNRKDGMNVNFETGEREGFPWNVPAILPTLVSGDDVPDTGDVATLLDLMVSGSNSVLPCDQSARDLSGRRSVKRSTRKFRKAG
jgi:hypothetical protein